MAITNAQQFKQLVNPPMKGNKRPGYRGDAAAAAGAPGMAGPGPGADPGNGGPTGAPSQDRIAEIRQANITLENLKKDKAEEAVEVFRNRNRGSIFDRLLNTVPGIGAVKRIASTFGPINNRDFFL